MENNSRYTYATLPYSFNTINDNDYFFYIKRWLSILLTIFVVLLIIFLIKDLIQSHHKFESTSYGLILALSIYPLLNIWALNSETSARGEITKEHVCIRKKYFFKKIKYLP